MGLLKHHDYVKILNYYDMPISAKDSSKSIKHKAEAILAEKLCKCIKKVKKNDRQDEDGDDGDHGNDDNKNTLSESESKAIAICSNSIFEKKGLERGLFDCKKKPRLINFQGKKYALTKKKRTLMMLRRTKLFQKLQTKRRKMKN